MSLVFNPFTGTLDFTGTGGGGGGTSPALPFDSVQFNNAGSFGGSANLTWDGTYLGIQNAAGLQLNSDFTLDSQQNLLFTSYTLGNNPPNGVSGLNVGAVVTASGTSANDFYGVNWSGSFDDFTATHLIGNYVTVNLYDDATVTDWVSPLAINVPRVGNLTVPAWMGIYIYDQSSGSSITNPYFLWMDTDGVFRFRVDKTFNSVSQAIPALYNPQFTKYTPGATDYERIVWQWESNVATVTTEKGGTGTLRALNLGDAGTQIQVNGKNLTLAGNISTSGAFASTFTMTNTTAVTFPTSGTLATTSQIPSGAALTKGDDTNVTLTLGGSASTSLVNAASITAGWTGTLAVARGGTAVSSASINAFNNITGYTAAGATGTTSTNLVFSTSPTLVTPVLGVATVTTINKVTLTTPATGATLTIADGKTLTASNSLTFTGTDTNSFAFPSGSDTVVVLAATQTLTNKRITKRVVTASDATSITPNSDSADVTYQANTQATGTLTINADGGSPTNGQSWVLKIKSTNVQTFSWNSIFQGGTNALPTASTGGTKIDYFAFLYDSVTPKWDYTGSAVGF